jgi:hypothetical protein
VFRQCYRLLSITSGQVLSKPPSSFRSKAASPEHAQGIRRLHETLNRHALQSSDWSFRLTFHWTDQKLRVHAFYCVLALMILNLPRCKLARSGIVLSIMEMMNQLTQINEITLLYPAPQCSKEPFVRTQLAKMNLRQKKLAFVLGLDRFLHY